MDGLVDWRSKVELLKQIRREYEFGIGTIQGVSMKFGMHRRMVREALSNSLRSQRYGRMSIRTCLRSSSKFEIV